MSLGLTWKNNLVVFGLLTMLVMGYFFYQQQSIRGNYQQHAREHSEILAAVVKLNVSNAYLTSETIETILENSLANSVRFISYLNAIEPFSSAELAAFAREAGLAGIVILDKGSDRLVSGPPGWLGVGEEGCPADEGLQFLGDRHLYLYTLRSSSCIVVGLDAGRIEQMQNDLSVERLLNLLNNMAGIAYVRVEAGEKPTDLPTDLSEFPAHPSGGVVSETTLPFGEMNIVVGLSADRLVERMAQLRNQFLIFLFLLFATGILSSWWLYRFQKQRIEDAREFEKRLARQHEAAALGRTTATITHEMRNPLNAIGIGLQRLEIEAPELSLEHRGLVAGMREAVDRSNGIISRLRQYVHSFELDCQEISLNEFLATLVNLYAAQCKAQGVGVRVRGENDCRVLGDKNLLGQVFENLLKNSIEAQPNGGSIDIEVTRREQDCSISFSNGGELPDVKAQAMLLEPFFTTKAKGTGLGLAISRKIVEAHGGGLELQIEREEQVFRVVVSLPADPKFKDVRT